MSTHTHPETRNPSPVETALEPDRETESTGDDTPAETPSYDAHDAAATFDTGSVVRLPNTVDDDNKYVG